MKWWKEVIRPGTYWYYDPQGKPQKMVVQPEHVRYWHDQGQKMLSAGLSIPIPLEHQGHLHAMTASEKSAADLKSNTGWVEKYAVRGDRLFALANVADDAVNQKLPSTIKYTSPWINSFTDGNGQKWEGVITHLALTSRPRITAQEPFTTPEAALSMSGVANLMAGVAPPRGGIVLSVAGLIEPGPKGALVPHFPRAFTTWANVKLAAGDEPPMKEPPAKKEGGDKEPPKAKEGDKPDMPEMPASEEMEMTLEDILREIVSALWGVDLPEDTDEGNLAQNLLKALMAQMKGENTDMNTPPPSPPATPPAPGGGATPPVVQETPPMYMSLEAIEKLPDPTTKALAKRVLSGAVEDRNRRVQKLLARIPAGSRQKLLDQVKGAQLSLGADGSVHDSLGTTLDTLESCLVDLPTLLTDPAAVVRLANEVPHPLDANSGMTPERLEEVKKIALKAAGVYEREKKAS